jgi:hypothetical protein
LAAGSTLEANKRNALCPNASSGAASVRTRLLVLGQEDGAAASLAQLALQLVVVAKLFEVAKV